MNENFHSSSQSTRHELSNYIKNALGDKAMTLDRDQVKNLLHYLCHRIGIDGVWTDVYGEYLTCDAISYVTGDPKTEALDEKQCHRLLDFLMGRPLLEARHPKNIVVLGGGAYGTAITHVLSVKGHRVTIVMQDSEREFVEAITTTHRNPSCFPDRVLHPFLVSAVTEKDMAPALKQADYVVCAVPVQFTLSYLSKHRDLIPCGTPIVCVSKGIDAKTLNFMSEIIPMALQRDQPRAFLAGPSFAKEMMHSVPTCVTVAAASADLARSIQVLFSSQFFRVFTTDDVIGVEVGSALKNVLAIATGVVKGLGYGPNTQMALVTRGWADIRHLARSYGAREETMTGLAGIGDVMLTCFGGLSRNANFGQRLAETGDVKTALEQAGGTVEGLPTASAIKKIAEKRKLRLPVLAAIADMVGGKLPPQAIVMHVMTLPLGPEESGDFNVHTNDARAPPPVAKL